MNAPFKTPIAIIDKTYLVAADAELICNTEAATPAELAEIVRRVNAHDGLSAALNEAFDYIAADNRDQALIDRLDAALAKADPRVACTRSAERPTTTPYPIAHLRYKHGGAGSWLVLCKEGDAEAFPVYDARAAGVDTRPR